MIHVAWRQFRTQAAVSIAAVIVVAAIAAITGPNLVHLNDTSVASCATHGDCATVTASFLRTDNTLQVWLDILVVAVPGIIGIFWGAPLVAREIEEGTFRLAWTQSVTRSRWLAGKVGLVGLAGMALAGLLSLIVTWWSSPLDRVNMSAFGSFDQRDIVPVGYAAFAFALGVTAGILIRRAIPAMATTLVAFVTARLVFIHLIRPKLVGPAVQNLALDPTSMGFGSTDGGPLTLMPNPPNIPNVWIYSTQIVDRAGHGLTAHLIANSCPGLGLGGQAGGPPLGSGHAGQLQVPAGAQQALADCVTKVSSIYHEVVTYQPANRYWAFQTYELAIFLGASVIVAALGFWWVRRRLS